MPLPDPPAQPEATTEGQTQTAPSEEWISPFEDELDVPTFIRKGQSTSDDEDDRDTPAFLRRSAD